MSKMYSYYKPLISLAKKEILERPNTYPAFILFQLKCYQCRDYKKQIIPLCSIVNEVKLIK